MCGLAPGHNYAVYNNSLSAIERAIKERIYYVDYGSGFVSPHKPDPTFFATAMEDVTKYFRKHVQYTTPLTAEQFAGTYAGRRRTIYEKACTSLLLKPIARKDSFIGAFIKAEKYNFTVKKNPAPRIIQPRDPRYIVESGRFVKPIEKKIYRHINNMFGSTTIFKGLNAEDRGAVMLSHWSSFKDPVAIGLDAKRFDQHVSRAALEWEHSIYKLFYPGDHTFSRLLSWQLDNVGFARCEEGVAKYTVDGCRMSGDTNTALGNCLIMSSLVYVYSKLIGVDIKLANDGDDCVVFLERNNLDLYQKNLDHFFMQHGFSMTVEDPVYILEDIEFCQSHPVYDGEKYLMVRDPRVAISKDCVALKPLDNPKIKKMWCAAVGQGGMSLTGGIPIWQDFYAQLITISDGAKRLEDLTLNTGMKILAKGMFRTYKEPTPESRLSFYLAFKISPSEQEACEEFYRNVVYSTLGDSPRFVPLPIH